MPNKEDNITAWFAQKAAEAPGSVNVPIGIGDDMAQVMIDGAGVLITADMLLDGVHFDLASAGPEAVGYKAMAASLSDCAAMATVPVCAVVSVGLAKGCDSDWLKDFHSGIVRAGDMFGCKLVGGDITAWANDTGRVVVNVAMLSKPAAGHEPVRRDGARVGDIVCVTGSLGGSIAGRHLEFVPRVKEALELVRIAKVNSMMDISDGISTDLPRICRASSVGAMLYADKVPLTDAAMQADDPVAAGLNDGEDFELLFTLGADEFEKLKGAWDLPVKISQIGVIAQGDGVKMRMADGNIVDVAAGGFDHL